MNMIINTYPQIYVADTCQVQCGSNSLCTGVLTVDTVYNCSCQPGFSSPAQNGTNCTTVNLPSTTHAPVTASMYTQFLTAINIIINLSTACSGILGYYCGLNCLQWSFVHLNQTNCTGIPRTIGTLSNFIVSNLF